MNEWCSSGGTRSIIGRAARCFCMVIFISISAGLFSQEESILDRISFTGDFRFRLEQDWNSKRSDGTFRNDRTRMRYRLRAGVTYEHKWYRTGFRIRTGDQRKQQDPQLTLGEGLKEFGTLPIGFEKAFFEGTWRSGGFWVGKNTYPFEKSNELFWSDNVYPEGVFLEKTFHLGSDRQRKLDVKAGHFIVSASGRSLEQDAYFQGFQVNSDFLNGRLSIFPSIYLFRNIPNIPDGAETFELDYSIFHFGSRFKVLNDPVVNIEFDYYHNWEEYGTIDSIRTELRDERSGIVAAIQYGSLKQKGDWLIKGTYAWLQQYAAVDIMAQNDWARWDYSAYNSPDGRLTNMGGFELVVGYSINPKTVLKLKAYLVEQLVPYGSTKETGSRVRLDIDAKF